LGFNPSRYSGRATGSAESTFIPRIKNDKLVSWTTILVGILDDYIDWVIYD